MAAGRPIVGRTVATRLEAGVTEALRSVRRPTARVEPKDARIDAVAAGLFVRAKAALEVAELLEKTPGFATLDVSRLPIEIFPLLRRPLKPTAHVTAIEMPYRLIASPLPGAGFTHSDVAVSFGGRTELWHTRLGTRRGTGANLKVDDRPGRLEGREWAGEKLRFIWSPDYPDRTTDAFRKALDATDRSMLVKLTAGFNEKQPSGGSFIPRAAQLRRMMLTALGGDLEAQRQWLTRPAGVDLMGWTHRAAIGRDYFVRVEPTRASCSRSATAPRSSRSPSASSSGGPPRRTTVSRCCASASSSSCATGSFHTRRGHRARSTAGRCPSRRFTAR